MSSAPSARLRVFEPYLVPYVSNRSFLESLIFSVLVYPEQMYLLSGMPGVVFAVEKEYRAEVLQLAMLHGLSIK